MNGKSIAALVLALGVSFNVFSAATDAAAGTSAEKAAVWNAETLSFTCGSKKLQFTKAGKLSLLSGDREIGKINFNIKTPKRWYGTGWCAPVSKKGFNGKQMCVTDLKVEDNAITFSGKVPWDEEGPSVPGTDWQIAAESLGNGKVRVTWSYVVPDGSQRKEETVFMEVKNCKLVNAGSRGTWDPSVPVGKKYIHGESETILTLEGIQEADSCRIETACWKVQGKKLRFRSQNKAPEVSVVIDLNEVPAAAKE